MRKVFKVAFKDESKPENGFDYIYVTKEDYLGLTAEKQNIIAEPITRDGQEVYRVTDIIGSEPDLGVENLKGSGLIAAQVADIFSSAWIPACPCQGGRAVAGVGPGHPCCSSAIRRLKGRDRTRSAE